MYVLIKNVYYLVAFKKVKNINTFRTIQVKKKA